MANYRKVGITTTSALVVQSLAVSAQGEGLESGGQSARSVGFQTVAFQNDGDRLCRIADGELPGVGCGEVGCVDGLAVVPNADDDAVGTFLEFDVEGMVGDRVADEVSEDSV